MAEAIADSLFSWVDEAGNTNTLDVDVVMSSSDKRTAKLTDHVVENGSVITDHVVIMPEEVSFELIVTQTPMSGAGFTQGNISITAAGRALQAAGLDIKVPPNQFRPGGFLLLTQGLRTIVSDFLNGGGGEATTVQGSAVVETSTTLQASVLQADQPVDRVGDAHDTLIDIMNNALLVTASFKGRLYLDYLITSVTLESAPGKFGCGNFKVDLRAFRTVTGTNVKLPDPADFRALPSVKKGNKPPKADEEFGPPPPPVSHFAQVVDGINTSAPVQKFAKFWGLGG